MISLIDARRQLLKGSEGYSSRLRSMLMIILALLLGISWLSSLLVLPEYFVQEDLLTVLIKAKWELLNLIVETGKE